MSRVGTFSECLDKMKEIVFSASIVKRQLQYISWKQLFYWNYNDVFFFYRFFIKWPNSMLYKLYFAEGNKLLEISYIVWVWTLLEEKSKTDWNCLKVWLQFSTVYIPHTERMIAGMRAARWMLCYQDDCLTVQWKETVKGFASSLTFQIVGEEIENSHSSSFSKHTDDKRGNETSSRILFTISYSS